MERKAPRLRRDDRGLAGSSCPLERRALSGHDVQTAPRASPSAINLSWLIRLRWGAVAGQALTIVVVDRLMHIDLPLVPLFAVIGVEAASNLACVWVRSHGTEIEEWHMASIMGFDVMLLTALLYFSGGPFNPFSFLYLVHIALAAVVLAPRFTWLLVGLSLLSFGALFFDHVPLKAVEHVGAEGGMGHVQLHVQGMWVAFLVAAAFIVYFVQRVTRALAEREAELAKERAVNARSERLASLAALAAGAAHELSTPLSTIAVVAKELARDRSAGEAAADASLIRQEVERCRSILLHLTEDAGQSAGEPIVPVPLKEVLDAALADLGSPVAIRVSIKDADAGRIIQVPRRAVTQALRAVLQNARQASRSAAEILVTASHDREHVLIEVQDHGDGMSPEHLARAGEPFFTTKEPGQGMGLGLFVTRTVLERLGGRLELRSELGRGTRAVLVLPQESRLTGASIRRVAVEGAEL